MWKEVQTILSESLSYSQVIPGPQDPLLRRGAVPVLRDDGGRLGWLPYRGLLQQGEEQLSKLQCLLYPHPSTLPGTDSVNII